MDLTWVYSSENEEGCWVDFDWGYLVVLPTRDFFEKKAYKCYLTDRVNNINLESSFCSIKEFAKNEGTTLLNEREFILQRKVV